MAATLKGQRGAEESDPDQQEARYLLCPAHCSEKDPGDDLQRDHADQRRHTQKHYGLNDGVEKTFATLQQACDGVLRRAHLLDRLLNACQVVAKLLPVGVIDGLNGRLERLQVGILDDFHARGTQLIKLVGFHFSIDAALVLCSFLCSFKQNFMGCFGQLVPGGHTHDKKRRSVGVARQRHVILSFMQIERVNDVDRIFLAVDGALLHGSQRFGPGHGNGIGAKLAEGIDIDGVFHDTNAQAIKVFGTVYRTLAIGQVAKAALGVCQTLEIDLGELVEQLLANFAVEYLVSGFRRGKQERQLEYRNFFQDRKSTRLNSSHVRISYAVFCLKKK